MAKKETKTKTEFQKLLSIFDSVNPKKAEFKMKLDTGEIVDIQQGMKGEIVDTNEAALNTLFGGTVTTQDKERINKLAYLTGVITSLKRIK